MKYTLLSLALVSSMASAQPYNNWMASDTPVKSGTGLCWRNSAWTPATAHPDCDGADLQPKTKPIQISKNTAKDVNVENKTATMAARAAPPEKLIKVNLSTDTLFDFDKSVIKPEGRLALDNLISQIRNISLEVIVAVGHTDSIGSDNYNMQLGLRRAQSVKAYLISKGISADKVKVESQGERNPIADNKTAQGRAKNRRVEITVLGIRKP